MLNPTRLTPFVILWPHRYLGDEEFFEDFNFLEWNDEYKWEQDAWSGYRDVAKRPQRTVNTARGDCEDYALVAASWLRANDRPATLVVLWRQGSFLGDHVVCYSENTVYSSGEIHWGTSLEKYVEDSEYVRYITREI